jgi:hypothetical protein
MKLVTRSLRSLATKLHILARQADIFGINQFTSDIHCLFFLITNIKVGNRIRWFCLPMPFRFRKHKGHDFAYDVSAEVIKKYIFVGRCMLSSFPPAIPTC